MWMQGSGWLCDSGALESMMNSAGLAGQSAHDPGEFELIFATVLCVCIRF